MARQFNMCTRLFDTTLNEGFRERKTYAQFVYVRVPKPESNSVCSYFLCAVALF